MLKRRFLLLLIFFACSTAAQADYTVDFVRISCIHDARFMDIEYRGVHNPAVTATSELGTIETDAWARNGFFTPEKLLYECALPESKYEIKTTQSSWSERGMCGAAPEITISLYREGEPLVEGVVFGPSCYGHPSITKITIEDGKQGWYTREAEVCFADGSIDGPKKCEWFFSDYGDFKKFPLRQADVERLAK